MQIVIKNSWMACYNRQTLFNFFLLYKEEATVDCLQISLKMRIKDGNLEGNI